MEVLAGIVSHSAAAYRWPCSSFAWPAGRAKRRSLLIGAFVLVALALAESPTWAGSQEELLKGLMDRYRPSGIELEDPSSGGRRGGASTASYSPATCAERSTFPRPVSSFSESSRIRLRTSSGFGAAS